MLYEMQTILYRGGCLENIEELFEKEAHRIFEEIVNEYPQVDATQLENAKKMISEAKSIIAPLGQIADNLPLEDIEQSVRSVLGGLKNDIRQLLKSL